MEIADIINRTLLPALSTVNVDIMVAITFKDPKTIAEPFAERRNSTV